MNNVKIQIGEDKKHINQVTDDWIRAEIRNRRNAGVSYCVTIIFNTDNVNMILRTKNCGPSTGNPIQQLTSEENRIYDLWKSCGLNKDPFEERDLISFINQIS